MARIAALRIELWSTFACMGGIKLGVLPGLPESGGCVTTWEIRGAVATGQLRLLVPQEYFHAGDLVPGTVARLVYLDGSIAAGAFDEYRIEQIDDASGADRGLVTVLALDPLFTLVREASLLTGVYTGVSDAVLARLLTDGAPAEFVPGTVTPEAGVSLDLHRATVQAALQEWGKQSNSVADFSLGESFEVQSRRNGVTSYYVDDIHTGEDAPTLDIRLRKNLHSLRRHQTLGDNPTRLYITAQGQVLGDAWFIIDSVTNGTEFVIGVEDEPDLNPILMDGAFTAQGFYILTEAGDYMALTDDVRVTRTLSVADTSALSAGMHFRFVANASGDTIEYLDIPNTRPLIGIFDAPFPPGWNRLPNANFAAWQGTSPDVPEDWDDQLLVPVAGEWEQETTDTLFGSAAKSPAGPLDIFFLTPSGNGWDNVDGRAFYCGEGDTVTYSLWAKASDFPGVGEGGAVWYVGDVNTGNAFGINISGTDPGFQQIGQWQELNRAFVVAAAGVKLLKWYIFKQTPDQYLIAGGRITVTPKGQTVPVGFFVGSSGAKAWVMGVNRLLATLDTHSYDVQFRDLTRLDSGQNPYDDVTLGQLANVTAPDLLDGPLTLRVVKIERNELDPIDTRLTLASRWQTLTEQLFGGLSLFNASTTTTGVGTPVNLNPDDPPPPPPIPAPYDAAYVLVGSNPNLTQARSAVALGGTTLEDGGPGNTLGIRSPEFYTDATDPAAVTDNDVADGDWWLLEVETDTWKVQHRESDAWVTKGWLVPDNGTEDYVLTWHADDYPVWAEAGAAASTIDVEDEGTPLGAFDTFNFVGDGVTATDAGGGVATITIPGSGGSGELNSYGAWLGIAEDEDWDQTTLTFEPVVFFGEEENDGGGEFTLTGDEVVVTTGGRYLITFNARTDTGSESGSIMNSAYAQCYASPGTGIYGAIAMVEDGKGNMAIGYGAVLSASGEIRANAGDKLRCKLSITRSASGESNGWVNISLRATRLGD